MGFSDMFSDFYNSIGFTKVHAEAPTEDKEEDEGGDEEKGQDAAKSDDAEGEDKEEGGEEGGDEEGGDEGGDDDEEEEEEEEEEPEDPKPKLEEECAKSSQCAPLKHHYDECAERVTAQHENPNHKGPKEDCVEEFFHLAHCANQCAAPKLFRQLK